MSPQPLEDSFARVSIARLWKETREAAERLDDILERMERMEKKTRYIRKLHRCRYCGEPTSSVVCVQHADLLFLDNLAPKAGP